MQNERITDEVVKDNATGDIKEEMTEDEKFADFVEQFKTTEYKVNIRNNDGKFGVYLMMYMNNKPFSEKLISPLFNNINGAQNWKEIFDKKNENIRNKNNV